jgi:hypothetical protein
MQSQSLTYGLARIIIIIKSPSLEYNLNTNVFEELNLM